MRQFLKFRTKPKWETLGFYACLAAVLGCVWYFPYLTSIDGPDHAANAGYIVDLLTGRCPNTSLFLEFNPVPVPNWLGHAVMALSIFLGAGLGSAEKIVFSLCVVLNAVGFRRLVSLKYPNDPRSWILPATSLSQPLVFGGVYNYMLGLGLFLLAIAFYFKGTRHTRPLQFLLIFMALTVLAWLSHVMAFLFIGLVVLVHEILTLFFSRTENGGFKAYLLKNRTVFIAFFPGLVLTVLYLAHPFKTYDVASYATATVWQKLIPLLTMQDFYQIGTNDPNLMMIFGPIAATLVFVIKGFFSKKPDPVFLTLAVSGILFWLLYFLAPFSLQGGWMVTARFVRPGWYLLLAAAMHQAWPKTAAQFFLALCVVILIGNVQAYAVKRGNMQQFIQDSLLKTPRLNDNAVFYTIDLLGAHIPNLSGQTPLFAPDVGTVFVPNANILADRSQCVVNLANYEALLDYFPLRFKLKVLPGPVWGVPHHDAATRKDYAGFLEIGRFDPALYKLRTGLPLDYILVKGDSASLVDGTPDTWPLQQAYYKQFTPLLDSRMKTLLENDYRETYRYETKAGKWITLYEHQP